MEHGPVFEGAPVHGTEINAIPAFAAAACIANSCIAMAGIYRLTADFLAIRIANTPLGYKGTARWARFRELCCDVVSRDIGLPYWGVYAGKGRHRGTPIFADFEASAFILGPSGSGKTTKCVQTNILAIRHSKTVIDFKSELAPMLARCLQQRGEAVHIINLGDLFADRLTHVISDSYNFLCIITDCFKRRGGLRDLSETLEEMCLQIYPEPTGGKSDDQYFRNGSRRLIRFAIVANIIVLGDGATLGDVLEMLSDREALLSHAQWITGTLAVLDENGDQVFQKLDLRDAPWISRHDEADIADFTRYVTGLAASVASLMKGGGENKTMESFVTGAIDVLTPYNVLSRAHRKTASTSFRFADQKDSDRPVTVFIMMDANKKQAQAPILGLIKWSMLHEMKAHPNKEKLVYLIADEATNIPWSGLGSLMTWGRSYGLRLMFIFQNFAAFKEAHGENTLQTLLSESEIACVLPGQRNPETLTMLEKALGNTPVMTQSGGGVRDRYGMSSFNISESERPLLTADEIKRMSYGMLFIRDQRPALIDLPSIAEIRPWAHMVDVNPFHNKPYIKKARLWIKTRKGGGV